MRYLLALSRLVDKVSAIVGKSVAWLILAAVLVSAGNATLRKAFSISSNAWLELQWYLYGAVFLLAASYTLQVNEHVRIDFLSAKLKKKTRDWIDLFGHVVFLLPFAALIFYLAVPWFIRSFERGEVSQNAGGLILWPAKIMVVLGFGLLVLQTFSEIIKRIAVIRDEIDEPYPGHELPPMVEDMEVGFDLDKTGPHGVKND